MAAAAASFTVDSSSLLKANAFTMSSLLSSFLPSVTRQSQTCLALSSFGDPLGPTAQTASVSSTATKQRKKRLKTFQRYLEIACWKGNEVRDLQTVLQAVGDACKQINRIVQRAQTDDLYGAALGPDGLPLDENVQGEVRQKLDVVCNTIMLRAFCGCSSSIAAVASEEEDLPRTCCDVMVRCLHWMYVCKNVCMYMRCAVLTQSYNIHLTKCVLLFHI